MDLMEYKAKELFDKYKLPVTNGVVVDDTEGLAGKTAAMVFPVVVKAQVQIGGRGKAGGIKFAETPEQLPEVCKSILGMDIKGHTVRKLLIVEKAQIGRECYLSIMLDRLTKCPMVIFSSQGGVDIEETARTTPEKVQKIAIDPLIGIKDYTARYLLSRSGLDMGLFDQMYDLLKKLYSLFIDYNCMLTEINPLAISKENKLEALDGKVSIDDSALYKFPDLQEYRDSLVDHELVLEARKFKFLYIPCDAEGNIAVMSNGSGMIMSCIDLIAKQDMKVRAALDLGGGATSERIKEAIRIVLSDTSTKALFINIFGGITRCDEVAGGVKLAVEELALKKLIIVRFEGTNKEKGLEILNSIDGNVVYVDGLLEGVKELSERRGQL